MSQRIRLKRSWSNWPKGHVFADMPAAQRQHLIENGFAEVVDEGLPGKKRSMIPGLDYVTKGGKKRA